MSSLSIDDTDEDDFYNHLIVLSSVHSLDKDKRHRIERSRGPSQPPSSQVDHSIDTTQVDDDDENALVDEKDIELRTFLDRLAEICASKHNGGTVTAVTVHLPSLSSCPEYLFVSNSRPTSKKGGAKHHIKSILKALCGVHITPTCTLQQQKDALEVYRRVLKRILWFNRDRLVSYLSTIEKCLQDLIALKYLDQTGKHLSLFLHPMFCQADYFADFACTIQGQMLLERLNMLCLLNQVTRIFGIQKSQDQCEFSHALP